MHGLERERELYGEVNRYTDQVLAIYVYGKITESHIPAKTMATSYKL